MRRDAAPRSREARQSAGRLCRAFVWLRGGHGAAWAAGAFLANALVLLGVSRAVREDVAAWRLTSPARIAIVEPHADDAAIEAGGLAIQNARLGGATLIVTVTRPLDSATAAVRAAESRRAWALVDPPPALRPLPLPSRRPWPEAQVAETRDSLSAVLREFAPELVVLPLDEGGHEEHDLVNRVGQEAARAAVPQARVVQASIYNPYYDAVAAPAKLLNLLVRFAPWLPYRDPTYGLPGGGLAPLEMTADELGLKRRMIEAYPSQADVIPLSQFGYADLYQSGGGRPAGAIDLAGKHLTVWSLVTLLSVFAVFGYAGFLLPGRLGSSRAAGAAALAGIVVIGVLGATGRGRLVVEELLYVACLLGGILVGASVLEWCRRAAR